MLLLPVMKRNLSADRKFFHYWGLAYQGLLPFLSLTLLWGQAELVENDNSVPVPVVEAVGLVDMDWLEVEEVVVLYVDLPEVAKGVA